MLALGGISTHYGGGMRGTLRAAATSRVSEHYGNRVSLQTDAGLAAAFLIGSGATIQAQSGLHPANWTDMLDSVTITAWAREIDAGLLSQGPEVEAHARGWQNICIIVMCLTPDPATLLANIRATPPLYQLVHAAHDTRGPCQAAIAWILAADADHLYLARANPRDDCQAMLLAAIGCGNP